MTFCRVALICHRPPGEQRHWDFLRERKPGSELCATWRLSNPCDGPQGISAALRLFDHRRYYLDLDTEISSSRVGSVQPTASGCVVGIDDVYDPSVLTVCWSSGQLSKITLEENKFRYERLTHEDHTSGAK